MGDTIEARIERVRRATRNSDILALCDEVDRQRAAIKRLQDQLKAAKGGKTADMKSYMQNYMREYRAGKRRRG